MTKKENVILTDMLSRVNKAITTLALKGEPISDELRGAAAVMNEFAERIEAVNEKEPIAFGTVD